MNTTGYKIITGMKRPCTDAYKIITGMKRRLRSLHNRSGQHALLLIPVICLLFCCPEVIASERGPAENTISAGVVRLDNVKGEPFSLIVNWPAHATVMGYANMMVTGDWPGAARRYIEREAPAPLLAGITAGASGDIDPIYRVRPDFRESEMEEIGIILGREVLRVADGIQTFPAGSVSAMQRVITLPGKKPAPSREPEEVYEPGPGLDVRLSLLRVGNILFAGISGEVFTEIGMKVKELSPFRHTWVITHCNGASGYLVTDNAYKEGGYEPSVTRAMPGAEGAIIGNLVEMMYTIGTD